VEQIFDNTTRNIRAAGVFAGFRSSIGSEK